MHGKQLEGYLPHSKALNRVLLLIIGCIASLGNENKTKNVLAFKIYKTS